MKKSFFKLRNLVLLFSMVAGLFFITACQTETITTDLEEATIVDDLEDRQKIMDLPFDPDFRPPNIPNPPSFDTHCVVRLSYLSFLERCPENASVVNGWIYVLNTRGFGELAKGFITSPEASHRWNTRYHQYLQRNNISSYQLNKLVYIAYRGLLLREPDVQGGIGWTNVLYDRGIIAVANGIGNSPEFARRLSRISTECNNAANQCTF